DQFALGAMVYEMLAGRRAFLSEGDQIMTTLYRILNEDPVPVENASVNEVLQRAMAKEPVDRYDNVAAFLSALEDAVAGRPIEPRKPAAPVGKAGRSGVTSLSSAASEVITIPDKPSGLRRQASNKMLLLAGGAIAIAGAAGF